MSSEARSFCRAYQFPLHTTKKSALQCQLKQIVWLVQTSFPAWRKAKQSHICEPITLELLSLPFLLISWAVSTKSVHEGSTKFISYVKWGSEQSMHKKTFAPIPVSDTVQFLSLHLRYFKEGWQLFLLSEPYNKILICLTATKHRPHPLKWWEGAAPGTVHKWDRVMVL